MPQPTPQRTGRSYNGGDPVVEAQVDTAGKVTSVKVLKGHPALRQSAEEAARLWEFAATGNSTIARRAQLTFVFSYITLSHGKVPSIDLTPVFMPPYQVEVKRELP